ncbi:MAG TPA: PilZ domain-containing protein [Thermodesulfobacteriota bacterium]|nr:PilZ domain-containing protein [Thermodesulfobacteriota bacterium]
MGLSAESLTPEKRKYPRVDIDLPVKYSSTNLIFKYGRVVNASQGGLLILLPEEMGIGQRLGLKIFFPSHSEFNTLETSVQVVWKDVHLRKDWTWDYRTGVKFINASPKHIHELKNFLSNIGRKSFPTA